MARLCEFPGLAPLSGVWGSSPNVPYREAIKEKGSQGAKSYLTVNLRAQGVILHPSSICFPPLASMV